jgi:DNA-binding transcriptional MerR regulator
VCYLSPQTLRYYHSGGLLVPADVDPQTGYRSYTFDQVEQAMLITSLRGTGMSVKLVRRALDEPDEAPALLRQHVAEVEAQRQLQDEAISDVRELVSSRPEAHLQHVPEATVVSRLVPIEFTYEANERYLHVEFNSDGRIGKVSALLEPV